MTKYLAAILALTVLFLAGCKTNYYYCPTGLDTNRSDQSISTWAFKDLQKMPFDNTRIPSVKFDL